MSFPVEGGVGDPRPAPWHSGDLRSDRGRGRRPAPSAVALGRPSVNPKAGSETRAQRRGTRETFGQTEGGVGDPRPARWHSGDLRSIRGRGRRPAPSVVALGRPSVRLRAGSETRAQRGRETFGQTEGGVGDPRPSPSARASGLLRSRPLSSRRICSCRRLPKRIPNVRRSKYGSQSKGW
jgi:hypothetical protein